MGKSDSHKVLYRKYRPQSFDEAVGQDHIVDPLKSAIKQSKVAHAYLFTGPKGVGKTSVARILAYEINGMDYQDQLPIDVIEIDGASNRRIDEIRELKERIHVTPVQAKYKVYIIDEVHMLTKEAFNALLKTLEEPPEHAVFILATTEVHKLPATIISRTQRYSFKPISNDQIKQHLTELSKKEGYKYDDNAIELIATMSGGSLRDALSLLDQISLHGDITLKSAQEALGVVDLDQISSLLDIIGSGSPKDLTKSVSKLLEVGSSPSQIASQLIQEIRSKNLTDKIWLDLIDGLLGVSASLQPDISLEVCLLRANSQMSKPEAKVEEPKLSKPESKKEPEKKTETPVKSVRSSEKTIKESPKKTAPKVKLDDNQWQKILTKAKSENNALYSVLRMSNPSYSNGEIELAFQFEFHQKQIENSKNKQIVAAIVEDVSGSPVTVTTIIDKSIKPVEAEEVTVEEQASEVEESGPVESVMKAFGGGEVVNL